MKRRVQNKHRRSAKKHLWSKSRSRKYKGGIPHGQGLDYHIPTSINSNILSVPQGSSIPPSQIQMPPPGYLMGGPAPKGGRRRSSRQLKKNKSKSRSRKYKIGAGGDDGTNIISYAHGDTNYPVYGTSAAPSTSPPKPPAAPKPK